MVYYQSAPLVIKTEQPSQAQYCTPLTPTPTVTSEQTPKIEVPSLIYMPPGPEFQQIPSNLYTNCNNVVIMQEQQQQSNTNKSIIATNTKQIPAHNLPINASHTYLHTNIKSESSIDLQEYELQEYEASPSGTSIVTIKSNGNAGKVPISRKPNKPQFKCEQCGITFGSKSAHTSHIKSHTKNIDLSVSVDATTTKLVEISEGDVTAGITKTPNTSGVPGSDPYQCNVCQKTFAVPARLIRHYRTHTGERPFECEFCHKLFSVKENLQVHRRIHTKERPYKCDVCERAFEHSGKLHRHMRIHTGERPHKCSVCEKTFIQSGQLVIHMRTHTGEKPYKCPVEGCGKGFTCSKQLKVHSRTHTGEKPYHCDICFRDFGYNHVLKLHRVQHYGSKCYKCTICDETFKSKKEMEAHIKGHAKEVPDDEDDTLSATVAPNSSCNTSNSISGSSSSEATSTPGSPASPNSCGAANNKARKRIEERTYAAHITTSASSLVHPVSPKSPRSTFSPSSSFASTSRLSADSTDSLPISPQTSHALEVDLQSPDSGVASASNNRQLSLALGTTNSTDNNEQSFTYIIDELPTDLSKQQLEQRQFQHPTATKLYQSNQMKDSGIYNQQKVSSNYRYQQLQQQQTESDQHVLEPPTINPALLEAASIVRRRDMLESSCKEEEAQSEIRLKQSQLLHNHKYHVSSEYDIDDNSLTTSPMPTTSHGLQRLTSLSKELSQYDDTREANELIEHYKRGELAQHGMHKGYAPVPKFEPSLLNNEIVRQVEAAIAPLRSSTESPERSSSPESDSMMMADRDVMTLPLRKRKVYMREGSPMEGPTRNLSSKQIDKPNSHFNSESTNDESNVKLGVTNVSDETGAKVMRMSSVIQFAKAS
ncbi:Krueppel homolog 1 isoform X2 [Eurosta solidaginis]